MIYANTREKIFTEQVKKTGIKSPDRSLKKNLEYSQNAVYLFIRHFSFLKSSASVDFEKLEMTNKKRT